MPSLSESSKCPLGRGELIERTRSGFALQLLQDELEQDDPVFSAATVRHHLGLECAHHRDEPARIANDGTNESLRVRLVLQNRDERRRLDDHGSSLARHAVFVVADDFVWATRVEYGKP